MVRPLRVFGLAACITALSSLAGHAQDLPRTVRSSLDEETLQSIDTSIEQLMKEGPIAGCSIGVNRGGETLLTAGYGYAHLELEVPATPETIYRLASVTKQFTAAATLRLVERGDLDLEDELGDLLETYDPQGHDVRLRHLLNHTSGIPSYTGIAEFWEQAHRRLTHEEMCALIQDVPFDFEPEEGFLYNNSGYYLLGMILEESTGKSYEEVIRDELFAPLGMTRSCYGWNSRIVRGRAAGYQPSEDGTLANCRFASMGPPGAAGALCSTVVDLLSWQRGLIDRKVLGDELFEAMTTPETLADGEPLNYAYGLQMGQTDSGLKMIFHGGGIFGFSTRLTYFPDEDLTVAVLTNTAGADVGGITSNVARVMIPGS